MDLCSQMPNASVFSFLPSAMRVQNNFRHSTISIPSCHRCLYEQERDEQPPFWTADWILALLPRCPKHLSLLSEHCPRCSLGLLSVRAHPGHGRLVVRCAACFSGLYLPSQDQTVTSPYINLVAAFGKTLIATCRGSDPDIMWLGPVGANTFLMVVDDLIRMLLNNNSNDGYALLNCFALAVDPTLATLPRVLWRRPIYQLSVRHRELVAAFIAFSLLGSQVTRRFELVSLPVPVSQLDSFPFSFLLRPSLHPGCVQLEERIGHWPLLLKERARRYLLRQGRDSVGFYA